MYPDPYNSGGPYYADPYTVAPRCPICGAVGLCVGTHPQPLALPPFDIDTPATDGGGPLKRYRVTKFGYTTVMQLNDEDAAQYGADAVPLP